MPNTHAQLQMGANNDKKTVEKLQQLLNEQQGAGLTVDGIFGARTEAAVRAFQKANDIRVEEIRRFPGSFRMGSCSYDRENGVIRYSFTQCPNAEFAKRHHMEDVLPIMCNCDHLAMQNLHACLIREGTCVESPCCDYCIVGDRHPIAQAYDLVKKENGLLVSVKK